MASRPTETRTTSGTVELRAATDGGLGQLGGYALKYRTLSQNLGGFIETIEPGVIDDATLRGERGDVLCRYQHEDNFLLGRLVSGTLRLQGDTTGLDYAVDLPDTDYARNVAALAARGDVRYSSFAFRTMEDDWSLSEQGFPLRTLLSVQLVDVAPVVTPAYMDTSTGLRSLADKRGLDLDLVEQAAKVNALAELLRSKEPVVVDLATPPIPDADRQGDTHRSTPLRRLRAELYARRTPL
jgi:HK97 family phage prohead protease